MKAIRIHDTGIGANRFQITSYGNGLSYNFEFGEAGTPMRNVYLQGDDAVTIRDEIERLEAQYPETDTRELWLRALDSYL